jgi:hypothetical protein
VKRGRRSVFANTRVRDRGCCPDPEAGLTRIPGMQRSTILGAIALSLVAAGAAKTAEAHGPCIRNVRMQPCLIPNQGPPGTRVTIVGTWAYRVVWNDPTTAYFLHSKNLYYRPGCLGRPSLAPRGGEDGCS